MFIPAEDMARKVDYGWEAKDDSLQMSGMQ